MFSKDPSYLSKKDKDECDFHTVSFYFTSSGGALFWKRLILPSITSLLVVIHSSKISMHYGGQTEEYLEPSGTSTMEIFSKNS